MSTRCNILITKNKDCTQMYHHYDGYPEGVGHDLYEILKEEKAEQFFDSTDRLAEYIASIDKGFDKEEGHNLHADIEYLYIVNISERLVVCMAVDNWDGLKLNTIEYTRHFDEWPEEEQEDAE